MARLYFDANTQSTVGSQSGSRSRRLLWAYGTCSGHLALPGVRPVMPQPHPGQRGAPGGGRGREGFWMQRARSVKQSMVQEPEGPPPHSALQRRKAASQA